MSKGPWSSVALTKRRDSKEVHAARKKKVAITAARSLGRGGKKLGCSIALSATIIHDLWNA
jgi:hypothetical protein